MPLPEPPLSRLRSLLTERPSLHTWPNLCDVMARCAEQNTLPIALDYMRSTLRSPDHPLADAIPPWWRARLFGGAPGADLTASAPVTRLDIATRPFDLDEAEALLSCRGFEQLTELSVALEHLDEDAYRFLRAKTPEHASWGRAGYLELLRHDARPVPGLPDVLTRPLDALSLALEQSQTQPALPMLERLEVRARLDGSDTEELRSVGALLAHCPNLRTFVVRGEEDPEMPELRPRLTPQSLRAMVPQHTLTDLERVVFDSVDIVFSYRSVRDAYHEHDEPRFCLDRHAFMKSGAIPRVDFEQAWVEDWRPAPDHPGWQRNFMRAATRDEICADDLFRDLAFMLHPQLRADTIEFRGHVTLELDWERESSVTQTHARHQPLSEWRTPEWTFNCEQGRYYNANLE